MPRSTAVSKGSSSVSKPSYKPTTTTTTSHVSHSVDIKQPGFFSNVFQGFGLGTGQSLAFNMFRSDPVVKHQHIQVDPKTTQEYQQCMQDYDNESHSLQQFAKK